MSDVVEASEQGEQLPLPFDVLQYIFELVTSHERRVVIPLVCKRWLQAVSPRSAASPLWTTVEIHDDGVLQKPGSSHPSIVADHGNSKVNKIAGAIRQWLWARANCIANMDVTLSAASHDRNPATPLASWCKAFGLALSSLATGTRLKRLTLRGPGSPVPAALVRHAEVEAADCAGTVLSSAFSLSSLEVLSVSDIPWAGALLSLATGPAPWPSPPQLLPHPSCGAAPGRGPSLANLRELTITRSFYSDTSADGSGSAASDGSADMPPDRGAAEAWQALGASLASLPLLERLDLSYTHAMTYIDPARGAVTAPWPPLVRLRHLSLANDLSVQPPPPPPPQAHQQQCQAGTSASGAGAVGSSCEDFSAQPNGEEGAGCSTSVHEAAKAPAGNLSPSSIGSSSSCAEPLPLPALHLAPAAPAATVEDTTDGADPRVSTDDSARDADGLAGAWAALAMLSENGDYGSDDDDFPEHSNPASEVALTAHVTGTDASSAGDLLLLLGGHGDGDLPGDLAAAAAAADGSALELLHPPMLTVDAAHAAAELLTWLPTCTALTSLDLRRCGLEAVPLAVAHLPSLARLDVRGNPLTGLRLPGPLPRLTWLALSTDPCYDMVYGMRAAEVGEAAAAEEMYVVELPAPLLEELEVDSSSSRALQLIREAATELPNLRRMVLTSKDGL